MQSYTRKDVEAEVVRSFGSSSLNGILKLLDAYPAEWDNADEAGRARVHLAILKLSKGDIARIKHNVEQACKDFRDVLYWAESH